MTAEYTSIKDNVLSLLKENLDEMQSRFGIDSIGIFGSVSRGEDAETSDIDIVYTFQKGRGNLREYAGAIEFLETLLGRDIDFVSLACMNKNLRPYIEPDIILVTHSAATA